MHFINTYRKIAGAWLWRHQLFNTFIVEKFEKLTRAEMKEVLGGTMVSPCKSGCVTDDDCKYSVGTTCVDDSSSVCPKRTNCGFA